jgi:hypothetical protein
MARRPFFFRTCNTLFFQEAAALLDFLRHLDGKPVMERNDSFSGSPRLETLKKKFSEGLLKNMKFDQNSKPLVFNTPR